METPAYRHNDTDDDEYRHSYCGNYGKNTGGDYDNHGQVQVSNIFQSASVQESDGFTTNNTNNSSDPDDENRHNDNDRSANGFDNDGKYQNSYDNDDNMPSADRHCENNESSAKSEHPDGSNLTDSICSRQDRGSDNKYNICSSKDATHARRDETDENGFMNRYLREYLNVYHEEEFESIDDSNTIKILCFGDSNTWGYNTAATLTTKMSSESPLPQRGGEFPKRFPKHVRWTGRLEFLLNKLAWTRGATDSHNGQNNAGKSAREDGSEGNIHRSFGDARGTKKARRGSPHAVEVVEAGLNGRTTVRDDPMRPYSVNGK